MGLTEKALYDERRGRIINPSLAEYHVPVNLDVPQIEIHFLNVPDPLTLTGAQGVGEDRHQGRRGGGRQHRLQRDRQARPRSSRHTR